MEARSKRRASSDDEDRRRSVRQIQPRLRWAGWTGRSGGRRFRIARRIAAVLLIVAAGASAGWQQAAVAGTAVLISTRDLLLGDTLAASDVQLVAVANPARGALTSPDQAVGHAVAGPVRRGEVLTDVRLAGRSGPDPGPGRSALAVRPADPAVTQLLEPGTPVTVATIGSDGAVQILSTEALVLALLDASADRSGSSRPVLLSVPDADADRVTAGGLSGDIALRVNAVNRSGTGYR